MQLFIDKSEVLRYLGYKGGALSNEMSALIDVCIKNTLEKITPRFIYRRFSVKEAAGILKGKNIIEHTNGCRDIYVLCATVGFAIEKEIRECFLGKQHIAVILDACGSAAIEALADRVTLDIEKECGGITSRFSPGYGDFPLDVQRDIISIMDAHKRIGLGVTLSMLLTPAKSITAIMGVTGKAKQNCGHKCGGCDNKDTCPYAKKG